MSSWPWPHLQPASHCPRVPCRGSHKSKAQKYK
uniref:Uncharacterized protein n=1 Tax=Anguilla anguilla TaxID=7936 RepID=A0A0E9WM93_ANGAN